MKTQIDDKLVVDICNPDISGISFFTQDLFEVPPGNAVMFLL